MNAERIAELKLWLTEDVCFRVIRGHESYWTIRDDAYKADLLSLLDEKMAMDWDCDELEDRIVLVCNGQDFLRAALAYRSAK